MPGTCSVATCNVALVARGLLITSNEKQSGLRRGDARSRLGVVWDAVRSVTDWKRWSPQM